jgi:hypothetical protein
MRVALAEDVQAVAVSHGQAAPARIPDRAAEAGRAPASEAPGRQGPIDGVEPGLSDVADPRRELPAGVHRSIREEGHEVERGAAADARASAEQRSPGAVAQDVEWIVLQDQVSAVPAASRRRRTVAANGHTAAGTAPRPKAAARKASSLVCPPGRISRARRGSDRNWAFRPRRAARPSGVQRVWVRA